MKEEERRHKRDEMEKYGETKKWEEEIIEVKQTIQKSAETGPRKRTERKE